MGLKTRIVFLGLHHPHIWSRLKYIQERAEEYEIVGMVDLDPEITKKFFAKAQVDESLRFDSVEQLLEKGGDICFIHALDPDICSLAIKILDYDFKALFLEKIGSSVPQELYDMVKVFDNRRPDMVIEWGWEMHYGDTMDYARDIVNKGVLGEITSVHFHGGCPAGAGLEEWQLLEESLGGYLYTDGSHTIEQVVDLFGIPQRLVSSVRTLPEGNETFKAVVVCDNMFEDPKVNTIPVKVGILKTEKGIPREDIASIICEYETMNVMVDFTGWEAHWWCQDWTMDIYGTNGTLHSFLQPSKVNLYLRESRGGYEKGDTVLNDRSDGNTKECFARQMEIFLKRVKLGKLEADKEGLEKCDIPRQIGIQKILDATFKSAKSRTFEIV